MLDKYALILQNLDLGFKLQDKSDWDGLWSKNSGLENLAQSTSPTPCNSFVAHHNFCFLLKTWQDLIVPWRRGALNTCMSLAFGGPLPPSCNLGLWWGPPPLSKTTAEGKCPSNHSRHLSRYLIRNGNWLSHCPDGFSADFCQEHYSQVSQDYSENWSRWTLVGLDERSLVHGQSLAFPEAPGGSGGSIQKS